MDWKDMFPPRLILAEDVRQTHDYLACGEVEASIIYASDVRSEITI